MWSCLSPAFSQELLLAFCLQFQVFFEFRFVVLKTGSWWYSAGGAWAMLAEQQTQSHARHGMAFTNDTLLDLLALVRLVSCCFWGQLWQQHTLLQQSTLPGASSFTRCREEWGERCSSLLLTPLFIFAFYCCYFRFGVKVPWKAMRELSEVLKKKKSIYFQTTNNVGFHPLFVFRSSAPNQTPKQLSTDSQSHLWCVRHWNGLPRLLGVRESPSLEVFRAAEMWQGGTWAVGMVGGGFGDLKGLFQLEQFYGSVTLSDPLGHRSSSGAPQRQRDLGRASLPRQHSQGIRFGASSPSPRSSARALPCWAERLGPGTRGDSPIDCSLNKKWRKLILAGSGVGKHRFLSYLG